MAISGKTPELLVIQAERFDASLVLKLSGELDLASNEQLKQAFLERDGAEAVILDLEELEFIDSVGLRTIYEIWELSRGDGFRLAIVAASPQVRRVMKLTGLDEILPLADDASRQGDEQ